MKSSSHSANKLFKKNLETISQYSCGESAKSGKANKSEITIDIHIKYLKLRVEDKTAVRIVWSRGKKQAKTQPKVLSASVDKATFDEKFQINTLLEIDPYSQLAVKEKVSTLTVVLDKSMGVGHYEIGSVDFNMADFLIGEYNMTALQLKPSPMNTKYPIEPQDTVIFIGLKGTLAHGLMKRSATSKQALQSSEHSLKQQIEYTAQQTSQLRKVNTGAFGGVIPQSVSLSSAISNAKSTEDFDQTAKMQSEMQTQLTQDIERIKRDLKMQKKDYDKSIAQKNTKINNLLTELENTKTENEYIQKSKDKLRQEMEDLEIQVDKAKRDKRLAHAELEDVKYEKDSLQKKLNEKKREEEDREGQHLDKVRKLHQELDNQKQLISGLKQQTFKQQQQCERYQKEIESLEQSKAAAVKQPNASKVEIENERKQIRSSLYDLNRFSINFAGDVRKLASSSKKHQQQPRTITSPIKSRFPQELSSAHKY